jgi:hypothetical protein
MPTDTLLAKVQAWLEDLWSDPRAAAEFAESPATSLAGHDLSESDLANVNLHQIAGNLSHSGNISSEGRGALESFSHSHSSGHSSPVHDVAFVTREIHHDNPAVTNVFNDNRTFIDQSHDFVNTGIIGDAQINIDDHSANAIGAGAVAGSGDANVVAATGAGSTAAQGSTVNQADHGSQVIAGSDVGQNQSNSAGGVQSGGDAAGVNTGVNTGVVSGGDTDHTVAGDGNRVADVEGHADGSAIGFGKGDTSAASGNHVHDGALSAHGNAHNVADNSADHGGAIGEDALGHNLEHNDTNVLGSEDTNLATDHSHAQAHQEVHHLDQHIDDSVIHDVPVV